MTVDECRALMDAMFNDKEHEFVDGFADRRTDGPHYLLYEDYNHNAELFLFDHRPHLFSVRLEREAVTIQNIRSAWDLIKEVRTRHWRE